MLSYQAARFKVIEAALMHFGPRPTETLDISDDPGAALGRVLAEDIHADRDYPSFDRSVRDGVAVRSADLDALPARLRAVGESKAGTPFSRSLGPDECVHIMTGAAVPAGADAIVMVEYTKTDGDWVTIERAAAPGDHIVRAGAEARAKQVVIPRGKYIGYAELNVAAQVGAVNLCVFSRPRVAILSTGDELVSARETPGLYAIRNSNIVSLSAQATQAGATPVALGAAADREVELREAIERGLAEDILVITGGVSMGKYDLVEKILKDAGAEVYFDAVAIRPGHPTVFGICRKKLVFGLPGNPVSAMVTFEVLVAPAIQVFSGRAPLPMALFKAKVKHELHEKPGLAHFLPARMEPTEDGPAVEAVPWQGSGDAAALVNANCFIVVGAAQEHIAAGDLVDVTPRRGFL
jgi:molybdopterin molybdotransferase